MVKQSDFGALAVFSNASETYSRTVFPIPSKQIEKIGGGCLSSLHCLLSSVNFNSFVSLSLTSPSPYNVSYPRKEIQKI